MIQNHRMNVFSQTHHKITIKMPLPPPPYSEYETIYTPDSTLTSAFNSTASSSTVDDAPSAILSESILKFHRWLFYLINLIEELDMIIIK